MNNIKKPTKIKLKYILIGNTYTKIEKIRKWFEFK